jgi:hypothetical protein
MKKTEEKRGKGKREDERIRWERRKTGGIMRKENVAFRLISNSALLSK